MTRLLKGLALAGALLTAGTAHAVPIGGETELTASGEGSVGYFVFDVTGAGLFDIFTMGPTIDPQLYLFREDGALDASDQIAFDDDGCPDSRCGPAGNFSNSLIENIFLATGGYVAAYGDYPLDQDEIIAGFNHNNRTGNVSVTVVASARDHGHAFAVARNAPASIPEPGSLALLGAGLAGFAAVRRRRPIA